MTTIKILRDTEITNGQILTTLLLLQQVANYIPLNGVSGDEMASKLALIKILKLSDGVADLSLGDADLATAKECVTEMQWDVIADFITAFIATIKSL